MARPGVLLLERSSAWWIGDVAAPADPLEELAPRESDGEELAAACAAYCQRHFGGSVNIVVALHATSVVPTTEPLGNSGDRRSLLYEMEAELPFDAEDAVADFCGGRAKFGVAVPARELGHFIRKVEEAGHQVQSVFPAAPGAVQQAAADSADAGLLWRSDGAVDLIKLEHGRPRLWQHLPDDPVGARRAIRLAEIGPPVVIEDEEVDLAAAEFAEAVGATEVRVASATAAVRDLAGGILRGDVSPWIELRRDVLANGDPNRPYRFATNVLAVTVCALLIAAIGANLLRAQRYQALVAGVSQQQRELFQKALPERRVPGAIMSRLRSEHARFVSSRQTNRDVELPESVLEPAHRFLTALPADLPVRFTEVRIENGKLDLGAEVKSFAEASRLARALESVGFDVTPETQQQLEDGRVATRLRGTPVAGNAEVAE